MTSSEAVERCDFWTTNVAETQALGSSTDPAVAEFFNASVSIAREQYTNPTGPRHFEIRVARWLNREDPETGDRLVVENELYTMVAAEIERRKTVLA